MSSEEVKVNVTEVEGAVKPVYAVDEKGRTVYPLKVPVKYGAIEASELRIRKPKTKDVRRIPNGTPDIDENAIILSRLAGVDIGVIDELSIEDFQAASDIVSDFFPVSLRGGKTP